MWQRNDKKTLQVLPLFREQPLPRLYHREIRKSAGVSMNTLLLMKTRILRYIKISNHFEKINAIIRDIS